MCGNATTDVFLWLDEDGMGDPDAFVPYSLSYWYNKLQTNASAPRFDNLINTTCRDEDNGMIICDVSAVPPNWNIAGIGQDFRFELRQKCSGPLQDDFPAQWIADNPKPPDAIQLGGFAWEYHLEAAGQRACWTAFEFWMLLQAIPDDVRAVMGRWA